MAKIRTYHRVGYIRVKVTGRLTARDVRRLEHACAPALTSGTAMLDIDLSGVTESDDTATLIVHHMAQRGARILPSLTKFHGNHAGRV